MVKFANDGWNYLEENDFHHLEPIKTLIRKTTKNF